MAQMVMKFLHHFVFPSIGAFTRPYKEKSYQICHKTFVSRYGRAIKKIVLHICMSVGHTQDFIAPTSVFWHCL